jgi:AraC-like DNA-binding protein
VKFLSDTLNPGLLFLAIDIANIVCSALFGARVLAMQPRLAAARLLAFIAFDSVCHFILSRYEYRHWIPDPYRFELGSAALLLNFARNLTPGLFMILCFKMFADARRFPRWLAVLFVIEIFLEVPLHWLFRDSQLSIVIARTAPALLQGLFAAFAIYWTMASWRADLIESRRRARAIIVVIIGLNIIASSLLLRLVIPQNSIANYDAHLALVVSNLLVVAFILVFLGDGDLQGSLSGAVLPGLPEGRAPAPSAETGVVLAQLSRVMEVERVYRQPSLSLRDLADLVGTPEYRLRKVIHEQLSYQNFNVFLHAYRIRDACLQLRDPKLRRIPILTVALSTGYQSVNTFNRGFREITGMTPSAYRSLDEPPIPAGPEKISPKTT